MVILLWCRGDGVTGADGNATLSLSPSLLMNGHLANSSRPSVSITVPGAINFRSYKIGAVGLTVSMPEEARAASERAALRDTPSSTRLAETALSPDFVDTFRFYLFFIR